MIRTLKKTTEGFQISISAIEVNERYEQAVTTFVTGVTVQGAFNVDSNGNLGNAIGDTVDVAGPLRVTGTATFVTNVTMNQGLAVDQSVTVTGDLNLTGSLDLNLGSGGGFTNAAGTWSGYFIIQHDGTDKYVPYLSSAP